MVHLGIKEKAFSLILASIACLLASGCSDNAPKIHRPQDTDSFLGQGRYRGEYWPTEEWRECRPEEVGVNSSKLYEAYLYAANPELNTEGIIVIRDGYIIGESYFGNFTRYTFHRSYSVAKSFTSALIGIAIDQQLIDGVEYEVYRYFPGWQTPETPALKKRITIRHLLTMTAGIEWKEGDYYNPYGDDDIYVMYRTSSDFIQYVLHKPMAAEPGTRWYYSSGETILLSGVIEAVTGKTALQYAQANLLEPIGITNLAWEHDPSGHTITGWGILTTVRNYARFGYLYLKQGMWDGRRIISESWIAESTRAGSDSLTHYAYLWWLPPAFASYGSVAIPESTFMALGIYLQRFYVVPEKNLVVVRVGNDAGDVSEHWDSLKFLEPITDAIVENGGHGGVGGLPPPNASRVK
jgi:CubicO group peptidase (beta-lactamase class C family)